MGNVCFPEHGMMAMTNGLVDFGCAFNRVWGEVGKGLDSGASPATRKRRGRTRANYGGSTLRERRYPERISFILTNLYSLRFTNM